MGRMERDLRRLVHSGVRRVRISLPQISPEDAIVVGNGLRRSADGAVALHSYGDGGLDRGRADRPDGRSCDRRLSGPHHSVVPRGLQGTMLMMSNSLYFVVVRFGDVLGTSLYESYNGFTVCVIAITVVYALILPALLLVPKNLTATADGQATDEAR